MEMVKYSIRKKRNDGFSNVHRRCRGAPYADAQYWGHYGRYGRCIVKGYPSPTNQLAEIDMDVSLRTLVATDQLGRRETYGGGTEQQPTMPSAALITGGQR